MITTILRQRLPTSITTGVNNNVRAFLCTLTTTNNNNNNSSNNISNSSPRINTISSSSSHQSSCLQYHFHPRHFSAFSRTLHAMEQMTMKVPTMGDSITEGTIVEWTVSIGQAVSEGDVICLVETDKVTVDIKAEVDGVIVAQYGAVDDTIEVGANLYQIDTTATATITPSSPAAADATPPPPTPPPSSPPPTTAGRKPSLTFLGKEGWAARLATGVSQSSQRQTWTFVDDLDPMYGRPPVTEREMEALMLGGANLAEY